MKACDSKTDIFLHTFSAPYEEAAKTALCVSENKTKFIKCNLLVTRRICRRTRMGLCAMCTKSGHLEGTLRRTPASGFSWCVRVYSMLPFSFGPPQRLTDLSHLYNCSLTLGHRRTIRQRLIL